MIISGSNLIEIRNKTGNISMMLSSEEGEILLEAALTKSVVDSYNYFNTDYNDAIIEMVVSEIRDVYKLHSLVEVLQAIKIGRRKQEKIYGKLSPAHILDWVKDFDNELTPKAIELSDVKSMVQSGNRNDKYSQEMTPEQREIFSKLLETYVKGKRKKEEVKAKQIVDDPVYQKYLQSQKEIAEHNRAIIEKEKNN